jgi:hypothetical protein
MLQSPQRYCVLRAFFRPAAEATVRPAYLLRVETDPVACPKLRSPNSSERNFLFAPSAPAVQIFVPAMGAVDLGQLNIEITLAMDGLRASIKEFNQADFFLGTSWYPDT